MHHPAEVARPGYAAADADAIPLARSGRPTVHYLDNDELISAVATSPIPVLETLGHATDDLRSVPPQPARRQRLGSGRGRLLRGLTT